MAFPSNASCFFQCSNNFPLDGIKKNWDFLILSLRTVAWVLSETRFSAIMFVQAVSVQSIWNRKRKGWCLVRVLNNTDEQPDVQPFHFQYRNVSRLIFFGEFRQTENVFEISRNSQINLKNDWFLQELLQSAIELGLIIQCDNPVEKWFHNTCFGSKRMMRSKTEKWFCSAACRDEKKEKKGANRRRIFNFPLNMCISNGQ